MRSPGRPPVPMSPEKRAKANERNRRYRERLRNDPELRQQRREQARDYKLRSKYGLTYEEFCSRIDAQGGMCALCETQELTKDFVPRRESDRTVVDHCHAHGHVRGILCSPCNLLLGYAQDDPGRLRAAIEYLEADR